VQSLFFEAEGRLKTDISPEQIASVVTRGEGMLWVDLSPNEKVNPHVLRDVFHFHPLAIEDCFDGLIDSPKVDDYGEYLFIIAQSIDYTASTERLDLCEVDISLGPHYVVTCRETPVRAVDELFEAARANPHLLERGADLLAHHIVDALVDLLLPAVEQMDDDLDDLERSILDRANKQQLADVLLLKRNVLRLRRTLLPQRDLVNRLSRGEFPRLIRPESLIFFRDVYDHTVRVEQILDGIRDLADSALATYLSAVNNRMNEVMKAMSVVAVIFLPLTLIASIYGTNLDYSTLGITFKYGFLLMLASMVLVAGGLILFFRRRGWF
jgi:magnesium transporter